MISTDNLLGAPRGTGIYLNEKGTIGIVRQLDPVV